MQLFTARGRPRAHSEETILKKSQTRPRDVGPTTPRVRREEPAAPPLVTAPQEVPFGGEATSDSRGSPRLLPLERANSWQGHTWGGRAWGWGCECAAHARRPDVREETRSTPQ